MASEAKSSSGRERRRASLESLRAQGLRQLQIWVPDIRSPAFRLEAHRQSLAVAGRTDDQAFIDYVSDWPEK